MKHLARAIQVSPHFLTPAVLLLVLLFSSGCKSRKVAPGVLTYRMGERVTVGQVIYNILHAEWKQTLAEGAGGRTPRNRFLVLRVSVTNSGPSEVGLPLLSLYDPNGKQYRELDDIQDLPGWLGLYRMLKQVESHQGTIVFDVPPGAYKLQVTDGGEPGNEIIAYVDIPLNLDADPVLAEPPALPTK
jgi:hypothetical protein